jgi:hypothetical protein
MSYVVNLGNGKVSTDPSDYGSVNRIKELIVARVRKNLSNLTASPIKSFRSKVKKGAVRHQYPTTQKPFVGTQTKMNAASSLDTVSQLDYAGQVWYPVDGKWYLASESPFDFSLTQDQIFERLQVYVEDGVNCAVDSFWMTFEGGDIPVDRLIEDATNLTYLIARKEDSQIQWLLPELDDRATVEDKYKACSS